MLFMCISWELGFQVLGQRVAGSEVLLAGGQLRHLEPGSRHSVKEGTSGGSQACDTICPDNTEQTNLLTTAQFPLSPLSQSEVLWAPFYGTVLIHGSAFQRPAPAPQDRGKGH